MTADHSTQLGCHGFAATCPASAGLVVSSATHAIDEFRSALRAHGIIPPDDILADGQLHRCDVDSPNGKGDGAYILHVDGIPAGGFQNWQNGGWHDWCPKSTRVLTPEERAQRKAIIERTRQQRDQDAAHRHRDARERAQHIWDNSQPASDEHPYLRRKGVKAYRLKIYRGDLSINGVRIDSALVIPLLDSARQLHGLQFITPEGEKRYLPGGRISGCYFRLVSKKDIIVIAEGFATAASIHEATGLTTAVAFDAGNLAKVALVLRKKYPTAKIIIAADNDVGTDRNTGVEAARAAAISVHGLVAVPELDGRKADFNDLRSARGDSAVQSAIESAKAPRSDSGNTSSDTSEESWPEPEALSDALPSVASFPPDLLPDALRPWVMDIAERTQAPVEYVAVSAIVSLGAALGRKVAVRPKRLDDWSEFPNLWGAVIGPPSWMKSPALDEGKRPLTIIEARILGDFELTHREWEADAEAAKVKRDGAKDRARKAVAKGNAFDKNTLVAEVVPDEPKPPRLIVNNATVPALCEVLRANQNGVLVYRDELSGLIAELDQEGMEGSRGFYLTGWSGKEGYVEDRIGRGTNLRVPSVCLSLLGGIQPSRVAPLLRETLATGGGDGFLARFSLIVWPDSPGEYLSIDREPNQHAREDALNVFKRMYELEPEKVGGELVDGMAPFLRLEPAAAEAFAAWDVELRNRLRSGLDDGALAAHLGKYPKMVCALALLDHLANGGTGAISIRSVLRALAWSELLESHARRLYASLGQAHVDAARSLLNRIRRGDLTSPFKLRSIYRRGWAHLADFDAARAAADLLESKGYLRVRYLETGEAGGRPTCEYHINPAILRPAA
jgi:putative DNA primase/helicase